MIGRVKNPSYATCTCGHIDCDHMGNVGVGFAILSVGGKNIQIPYMANKGCSPFKVGDLVEVDENDYTEWDIIIPSAPLHSNCDCPGGPNLFENSPYCENCGNLG